MLFQATLLVDLIAMSICLWMAFYLFARGFPSAIAMRAAVLLLALGAFFFGAYNNLFIQIPGTAAWRAAFLIAGLTQWYHITLHLLPEHARYRSRPLTYIVYIVAIVTVTLLLRTQGAFVGEVGNVLYVARMGIGLPYMMYGVFEIVVLTGIHYNLLAYKRVGLKPEGRYFLFASLFALFGVSYGIVSLALSPPMPRLVQDLLVFSGVFVMGLSVTNQQVLVERRTSLQEFPVTGVVTIVLVIIYAIASLRLGLPLHLVGPIAAFVVLTHALYDLAREYLERLRARKERQFRKELYKLEAESPENTLRLRLSKGLETLCHTLDAPSGIIAVRSGQEFVVAASRQSVEVESQLPISLVAFDELSKLPEESLPGILHIAPSFDGRTQIAVVGIGKPNTKLEYSTGDLELLAEVADQVGTLISLANSRENDQAQSQIDEVDSDLESSKLIDAIEHNPDPDFIKIVEEGLRHLSDYITLGQSALADKLGIQAGSHIERGRELQKVIIGAIELLRPAEKRPPEPLPRVWYNHAVLHDAYVEGVPNREIMARLYISEGTFNRTRRNAIRGLARLLMEKYNTRK
ncbi:MAG: hypothetical protein HS100_05865 [Anaerolineales bacterium]|nr:hypothetical protein [Anaerolineales bacterium]